MDGEAGADRHQEIELKLLAPAGPRALEKFLLAPAIVRSARGKGVVRRLDAIYYDTADHRLFRYGASLRVRGSGKRHIQTLKLATGVDPLRRPEFEMPVPTSAPDIALLPAAEIGAPFDLPANEELRPMFVTRIRRHLLMIDLPDAQIELVLDDGTLEADGRIERVSELELELKSGDAGALYELGMALLDIAPLRIGTRSKAERGYSLALGALPSSAKAAPTGIAGGDTVDEAIGKILASCHVQMLANLAAVEHGEDADGVHQLRVGLRRLRSALSLIRREIPAPAFQALAQEARWLAGTLGPARAWDVFLTTTVPAIAAAELPGLDLAGLLAAAEPFRGASYGVVREALGDPRCTRFLLSLGRLIERKGWRNDVPPELLAMLAEPAQVLAARILSRARRAALKRGRHFDALEPGERHELRLKLKKLRYATEFFIPLYRHDPRARKYLKRLSSFQDVLGADNDVVGTGPLLRQLEVASADPGVHRAIGVVMGWQERDRQHAAGAMSQRWRRFRDTEPFWPD